MVTNPLQIKRKTAMSNHQTEIFVNSCTNYFPMLWFQCQRVHESIVNDLCENGPLH